LVGPRIVWEPLGLSRVRAAVASGVAPSPASLVSSLAGSMLSPVLVSEGQRVVTLAGVLVIATIAWIVVAWIVVAGVSTVTATVATSPSEDVSKTKEPDPDPILPGGLASSSPATVTARVTSAKQSKQTSVGVVSISLPLPSSTWVVVVAVVAVESPTKDGTT